MSYIPIAAEMFSSPQSQNDRLNEVIHQLNYLSREVEKIKHDIKTHSDMRTIDQILDLVKKLAKKSGIPE